MKRYWKLIILTVMIVFTIGTFYVKQSLASENDPKMVLETKSGDAKAADNLILNTNIGAGEGRDIEVTTKGSNGVKESMLGPWLNDNQDEKINRLEQEYRNFMRGKAKSSNLFAEDDDVLAYADFDSRHGINIDWVDKETKNRSSFAAQLPGGKNYRDSYVEHVYITNGKLKVVTRNEKQTDGALTDIELHIYTVDLQAEKIIDDDTVLTGSENTDDNNWMDMHSLADDQDQGETNALILVQETESDVDSDASNKQVVYYDLQTKKRKELSLPSELQGQPIQAVQGTSLVFSEQKGKEVALDVYDADDQEVVSERTIKLPDSMDTTGSLRVNDGKLYITAGEQKKEQDTAVIIVDIKSGETIYEGTITMNQPLGEGDLFIYSFSLKDDEK